MRNHLNNIIEEFSLFDTWEEKYTYLIELGKQIEPLNSYYKSEQYKVEGCISQVWLVSKQDDSGRYHFLADSDAYIVKGLIAILLRIYSGATKEDVNQINIEDFFQQIGFKKYLSPSRSNGFFAIVKKLKKIVN